MTSNEPKSRNKVREVIRNEIKCIRRLLVEYGLSEQDCLRRAAEKDAKRRQEVNHGRRLCSRMSASRLCRVLVWVGVVTLFLSCHKPTHKFVIRHTQSVLYPIMRMVRMYTLPVLISFPWLSELYDEECLVYNPLYQASSTECWVCSDVKTVIDLTGLRNITKIYYKTGLPFIAKDVQNSEVTYQQLKLVYMQNKKNLQKGTSSVKSNQPNIRSIEQLLTLPNPEQTSDFQKFHATWKVTRVPGVHVLRQIFDKPYYIPKTTEVAMQRFVFIDGPQVEAYSLPITDFANVWITQASGHRFVLLMPSRYCSAVCPTLPVVLEPKDVLFYNCQLWKAYFMPMARPDNITITFMGSFY